MATKTDKKKYQRHVYSGPLKSRKRVLAGLKRYTDLRSRVDFWRGQEEDIGIENNNPNTNVLNKPKRTYNRAKPILIEAPNAQATAPTISMEVESDKEPLQINWPQPDPLIDSVKLNIEASADNGLSGISGYRIVELRHVIEWCFKMQRHTSVCESSQIEFVHETRSGFQSNLTFKCSMCDKTWKHCTESTGKVNTSFVWGTVTAGSYYTQAAHITNLMDIPSMSAVTFRRTENKLGKVWCEHLTEEIKKAGEEERSIAIEKGHVSPDGVPFITVYVDGGWLKRSYGHNFNSPSGMACIIGKETKKCLFLGVRNKYCYTCQYYEKRNTTIKAHNCCKNFTGPSTAMESNIILEGFQKSVEMHQLRYLKFIGDGDSSVFANLKDKVPYGNLIKKLECKNHVIKNYTSALYKILANTKLPLYGRNILKSKLMKLTLVARKMIMHNNGQPVSLAADLRNGPLHVFGNHENCMDYYCNLKNTPMSSDNGPTKVNDLENLKRTAPEVWALIYAANENIALKAGRLSNETTNVAENFMSVINKYNCGKRISLGKGGSYQRRVHVAGLSHATGYKWYAKAWKKQTTQSPGLYFRKYMERKEKNKLRQQSMTRRRMFTPKEKHQVDKDYGPNACDPIDINGAELKTQCEARLAEFQKSPEDIASIELITIGQHENNLYNTYRRDRLTASQFGMVCKRRNSTPCHNHVKGILYKNHNMCTKDMLYGQQNEIVARSIYMQQYGKTVRPSGIFIDAEFGFLAASPDGIIEEEKALIEIKCFPSLVRKSQTIEMAAKTNKNFPLLLDDSNGFIMNKKHDYYYQVQGQLRVSKMQKCYFICFTSVTDKLTVIEVHRDEEFISNMIPKLVHFFKTCILPEIILRRIPKNSKCVDMNDLTQE